MLLAQAKLFDQLAVVVGVGAFQVIQHLAALAHHFQQPTTGMVILDVCFEMLGQVIDAGRQQGYLHLGGTRVTSYTLMRLNDLRLLRGTRDHVCIFAPGKRAILSCNQGDAQALRAFPAQLSGTQ
jgi:hypothetical protein